MQIQFTDNIYLLINILLYLSMFLYNKRHYGNTMYTFIWLEYLIVSILSLYIWNSGIYYNSSGGFIKNNMNILPFLIIFSCTFLLLYPLKNIDINNTQTIKLNPKVLNIVNLIGIFIAIIFTFSLLPYLSIAMAQDAADTYDDLRMGEGLLPHSVELIGMIYSIFSPILILSFFYFLTEYKYKSISYIIILFIAAIVPGFIKSMCYASRGAIFFQFFNLIIGYILFKNCISKELKRKIYIILSSIVSFFGIIVFGISVARSGNDNAINEIFRYFGESFLNLNIIFWGNIKQPIGGERIFPYVIEFFHHIPPSTDTASTVAYYSMISGTPIELFKMIYGDFYVEFGFVGMFIAIIILFILGTIICKKKTNRFLILFLYYTYSQIAFSSIFDFTKAGTTVFKVFIFQIMIIILIDKKYIKNKL